MVATHRSLENRTYEWRVRQLKNLQAMLEENKHIFQAAVAKDLGRHPTEAVVAEVQPCESEIKYMLHNLKRFMQPEAVPSPAVLFPCSASVETVPLPSPGVLIIGPSNYPLNLVIRPLVGVLAGGNPAVIKPSELTPHTSGALAEIVPRYFDAKVLQIVLGGVAETSALLEKPWGKVLFTGSERVGKVVARACAETLTPCVLELGGKCCAVVDESVPTSKLSNVADRLVFSKCFNAGQTCVAPDTLLVHESHVADFCTALKQSVQNQFGIDPQKGGEYPRIVTTANAKRLVDLLREVEELSSSSTSPQDEKTNKLKTKVILGGSKECDIDDRYIAPTVVVNPPMGSRIIQEEIFGPIFPIVPYSTREEAIHTIQNIGPGIPLYLYVFCTDDDVFRTYTDQCPSGGAVRNGEFQRPILSIIDISTEQFSCFTYLTHPNPYLHKCFGKILSSNWLITNSRSGVRGQADTGNTLGSIRTRRLRIIILSRTGLLGRSGILIIYDVIPLQVPKANSLRSIYCTYRRYHPSVVPTYGWRGVVLGYS
jgi:acyl-CoA reductase-like NAD-dependent aldehyde dehydrogenase